MKVSFHRNGFWFHVTFEGNSSKGKDQHEGVWYFVHDHLVDESGTIIQRKFFVEPSKKLA